ncbi:hypothetical protein CEE69_05160 [Rhodopirellula bahusiensis]|uniref:Uncharacterized protein n=1 Tax=Rhodopirellula bahusiensis TaxID=2014065 RepID=A0A2G1WD33_9BACT|nr:hypothetical protein CEE69_05160 [Rhodopirellula bahusiensis]
MRNVRIAPQNRQNRPEWNSCPQPFHKAVRNSGPGEPIDCTPKSGIGLSAFLYPTSFRRRLRWEYKRFEAKYPCQGIISVRLAAISVLLATLVEH